MADEIRNMRESAFVRERELGNGISSFNFTREAFCDDHWNDATIHARGLFVNTSTDKVAARSFDKFFNYKQRPETSPDALRASLAFPLRAYRKENGSLGIISSVDGELFVASKSTNASDFTDMYRDMLSRMFTQHQLDAIEQAARLHDSSFVCEMITPLDPHIIDEPVERIVLLAVVRNGFVYEEMPYDGMCELGLSLGFEVKALAYELENWEEFEQLADAVAAYGYMYHGEFVEGFVLEDANGFQFKLKSGFYLWWKAVRSLWGWLVGKQLGANEIRSAHDRFMFRMENYVAVAGAPNAERLFDMVVELASGMDKEQGRTISVLDLRRVVLPDLSIRGLAVGSF